MKKLHLLIWIILGSTSLMAQSYLGLELGTDKASVEKFLGNVPEITFANASENMIVATATDIRVEYYFNQGVLYKQVAIRHYDSKKEASGTMDELRHYYTMRKNIQIDLEMGERSQHFAALSGREIHDVAAFEFEKDRLQITQSKMDLDRCPGEEMIQIVRDQTMLAMLTQ